MNWYGADHFNQAPPNGNLTRRRYYTTSTSRRQSSSSAPTPTPSLDLPDVELQKLEAPRVFSSNSTDPWFNLSYEEESVHGFVLFFFFFLPSPFFFSSSLELSVLSCSET